MNSGYSPHPPYGKRCRHSRKEFLPRFISVNRIELAKIIPKWKRRLLRTVQISARIGLTGQEVEHFKCALPQHPAITLGSGDNDAFTYDPNTDRMTQYQFNIGATVQSVVGALTWNQNGTLATQKAIKKGLALWRIPTPDT